MAYDDILVEIGEFGRFQKLIFVLASFCVILAPLNVVSQIFIAGASDHWCHVEIWPPNCTCAEEGYCDGWTKNVTIPVNGEWEFEQCTRYAIDPVEECGDIPDQTNATIPCDDGWVYDRSQYKSTIVTDFDLVCGRERLPDVAQTVYFSGIIVGSLIFGSISDKFGRRMGMFSSILGTAIAGILVALSQSMTMYIITRFFLAAAAHNTFLTSFVLVSELVGPSKRVMTGMLIENFFALGIILLPIIAYFIRYWRILQLVITLPGFGLILFLLIIPESPRWLISKGRWKEAAQVIRKTARLNGVELKEEPTLRLSAQESEAAEPGIKEDCSLLQLLKIPSMRFRTMSLIFNWCVQSFVYYGLMFTTPGLGVNIYVALVISGAVEVIAYTFSIYLIEKMGRRLSLAGLLVTVGFSCLITVVTPGVTKFVFGMIGKAAISATFGIVFVYTAELYPTPIRAMTIGIGSLASRAAAMFCPVVIMFAEVWPPLPTTLFALSGFVAAALTLPLPETKGLALPETMKDAVELGKRHTRLPSSDGDETVRA